MSIVGHHSKRDFARRRQAKKKKGLGERGNCMELKTRSSEHGRET